MEGFTYDVGKVVLSQVRRFEYSAVVTPSLLAHHHRPHSAVIVTLVIMSLEERRKITPLLLTVRFLITIFPEIFPVRIPRDNRIGCLTSTRNMCSFALFCISLLYLKYKILGNEI